MPTAVSTVDFWKLFAESRLVSTQQAQELEQRFAELRPEAQGNPVSLAQWLMGEELLSRYQAKVLLAGRSGPFVYGDYIVHDRHSEGRLQGAFRATHPGTRHKVLLYFHTGPVVQDSRRWTATVEQIAKFGKVIHPHVVRVYHLCDLGQYKFTVMDDLQGDTAADRLAKGPIAPSVACRMVRQVALGVAQSLQSGQIHGAIRPSNFWIDKQGNVQLLLPPLVRDPLIAPKPSDVNSAGASDELLRQADYLAPELSLPKHELGPQTEVYALGCTLYELLMGRVPFGGVDLKTKLAAHAAQPVPQLDADAVPAPIAQLVSFAMAKDPAKRIRNPAQMAETIGKVLEKIDRAQLRWPPSLPPSRLPEYEAWLRPYGVRAEEPGRASGMNVLWSKDANDGDDNADEMEALGNNAQHLPRSSGQSPMGIVQQPLASPARVSDSPLDWVDATPRGIRQAGRTRSTSTLTLILTIALVILSLIGAVVLGILIANRNKAEQATSARNAASATESNAQASESVEASTPADEKADRPDHRQGEKLTNVALAAVDSKSERNGESQIADSKSGTDSNSDSSAESATVPLWSSPTKGAPLTLKHIAPGLQAVLVLRPAELSKHAEGAKILAAIGPEAEAAQRELESLTGTSLAEIEQLTIAWVEPMDLVATALTPMFVVHFVNPPDREKVIATWGKQTPKSIGSETVFQTSSGFSAFWPSNEAGKVLVLGPTEPVEEAAKLGAAVAPVRRELERLLPFTDADRLATLLFVPSAALKTNPDSSTSSWQSLLGPGQTFFGADIRAALVSAHLTKDDFFVELRAKGPLDRPSAIETQQFRERLGHLADSVEAYIATLNLSPYGKRLLLRYPQMIKLVDEFTRGAPRAIKRCCDAICRPPPRTICSWAPNWLWPRAMLQLPIPAPTLSPCRNPQKTSSKN